MKNIIFLVLMYTLLSCGGEGGTTTGNPITVNMKFASFNNSVAKRMMDLFIPSAHAALTDFKMCFKRMRFKAESSSTASDIELDLGEVTIKQEGTDLGTVSIGEGTYKRIEFDLEKDCEGTTTNSVTLLNDQGDGNHSTIDRITIKFEGNFNPADGDLTMFVQTIVNAVKDYDDQTAPNNLKDTLEGVSGTY